MLLHRVGDEAQPRGKAATPYRVPQIEVDHVAAHVRRIEEAELLLVAQELDGWLAQDGEVERGSLWRAGMEEHLVRERRLACPRSAGDDRQREARQAPTQDLVQVRHARGE